MDRASCGGGGRCVAGHVRHLHLLRPAADHERARASPSCTVVPSRRRACGSPSPFGTVEECLLRRRRCSRPRRRERLRGGRLREARDQRHPHRPRPAGHLQRHRRALVHLASALGACPITWPTGEPLSRRCTRHREAAPARGPPWRRTPACRSRPAPSRASAASSSVDPDADRARRAAPPAGTRASGADRARARDRGGRRRRRRHGGPRRGVLSLPAVRPGRDRRARRLQRRDELVRVLRSAAPGPWPAPSSPRPRAPGGRPGRS